MSAGEVLTLAGVAVVGFFVVKKIAAINAAASTPGGSPNPTTAPWKPPVDPNSSATTFNTTWAQATSGNIYGAVGTAAVAGTRNIIDVLVNGRQTNVSINPATVTAAEAGNPQAKSALAFFCSRDPNAAGCDALKPMPTIVPGQSILPTNIAPPPVVTPIPWPTRGLVP